MKPKLYITQTRINETKFLDYLTKNNPGKWLITDYVSKSDFKEDYANLNIEYPTRTNIYLGNLDDLSLNFQQSILKFLEEPPANLQIFISKSNEYKLLGTIKSRTELVNISIEQALNMIDQDYIDKLKGYFLPPSDAVKKLLNSSMELEDFGDLANIERSDLNFYLWQIKLNLTYLYASTFDTKIAKRIIDIQSCQQNLLDNCQKKISLSPLLF
ncbi:MAG: hypothetical protein ACRCXZ_05515 [Patescibacteria group bacterium]